jgi:ATP-dependent RNA helicase RhlE
VAPEHRPRENKKEYPLTDFASLGLAEPLLRAVAQEGYTLPTPIQAQTIPYVMQGRDLLGIAQTGTGKTAAFALPILHRLAQNRKAPPPRGCRVLVLAPTRELAAQIAESFETYGRHFRLSVTVVVGGVKPSPQIRALSRGVDVLVATPGRLNDHLDTGAARLDGAEILVLDEADHMLDLGFLEPIKRILRRMPKERQTLFFSATMPSAIGNLAKDMLRDPASVAVTPVATTAEKVSQQVYLVEKPAKPALLIDLLSNPELARTLVFTRTKRGADRVAERLEKARLPAAAIHGNKSQSQRERALASFRSGRINILVATDIAARGIDIDGITHVVNFDLPEVPEAYVHRIGRTARAGAAGIAISFCDSEERGYLRDIERTTRQKLPVTDRRGTVPPAAQQVMVRAEADRHVDRQDRGQDRPTHKRGNHRDHKDNRHRQPRRDQNEARAHADGPARVDGRAHGDGRSHQEGRGHGTGRSHNEGRGHHEGRSHNDGRAHHEARGHQEGRGHGEGRGPRSSRPSGRKNRRRNRPDYQPNLGRAAAGD